MQINSSKNGRNDVLFKPDADPGAHALTLFPNAVFATGFGSSQRAVSAADITMTCNDAAYVIAFDAKPPVARQHAPTRPEARNGWASCAAESV
jgi:hypothetical protein